MVILYRRQIWWRRTQNVLVWAGNECADQTTGTYYYAVPSSPT